MCMVDEFNYIVGANLFVWFDVYFGDVTGSGFRCASDGRRIFRTHAGVPQSNCAGLPGGVQSVIMSKA